MNTSLMKLIGFLILASIVQVTIGFEEDDDSENITKDIVKRPRVDLKVKRPYRICQGFEDPAEVDCYLRSDVKTYVCTEPVTFNPCESEKRVVTYHYDHIRHRCDEVDVPACPGYIIRSLTLIQCLIYCHNKDPFALGKSDSAVFKLNQPKPYIPRESELETVSISSKESKVNDLTKQESLDQIKKIATGHVSEVNAKKTNLNNAQPSEELLTASKKSTQRSKVAKKIAMKGSSYDKKIHSQVKATPQNKAKSLAKRSVDSTNSDTSSKKSKEDGSSLSKKQP